MNRTYKKHIISGAALIMQVQTSKTYSMKEQIKKTVILLAVAILSVSFSFAQDTTERYSIKHLNECNDELSNFGTTFYGDSQMIYSSPTKLNKTIRNIWDPNQQPFLELYLADIAEDGELVNRIKINSSVNTKYHESNVAFTNDMKTVYFSRDKYYKKSLSKDKEGVTHIAMYKADVISPGVWENIEEMPFNSSEYCVGHPTLSTDNKTLYFSSELRGSDDIYRIAIKDDGTYGEPINLGSKVNTKGSERFPFMGEDNMLYFSSDKEGGYGDLDIYVVRLDGTSEAINLGESINSIRDDFSFTKKKGANYGYFTSKRDSGKGDDDIYYFKELVGVPCNQIVKGIVTNKKTGRRIPGALVVIYDSSNKIIDEQIVDGTARFSFEIDCTSTYKVEASKEGFSLDSKEVVSSPDLDLILDLNLGSDAALVSNLPQQSQGVSSNPAQGAGSNPVRAFTNFETSNDNCQEALNNINTIYFDLNKSYIRPDAAYELDKVVDIMKRCKNVVVEIGSHTDSRASYKYNRSLSQRRAISTMRYIRMKGISDLRISAKGYGETQLLNRCSDGVKCTEEEHQKNRRTEFRITN